MITQTQTNEKTGLRELTDLEIENVSGGVIWLAVLIPLACFATGVAVGATLAK